MNPFETFEQETQKHHEDFRQRVDKLNQDFNRDLKRILCITAAVILALTIIQALILWLSTGK